jgi:hypothetical protein
MLPVPHIRTVSTPASVRKVIKVVDDYTLWAFNPPSHLVRGYSQAARRTEKAA